MTDRLETEINRAHQQQMALTQFVKFFLDKMWRLTVLTFSTYICMKVQKQNDILLLFCFSLGNLSGNIEDCVNYTFVAIKETELVIEMHPVHDPLT